MFGSTQSSRIEPDLSGRPDAPAQDAEVLRAQKQPSGIRRVGLGPVLDPRRAPVGERLAQDRVLVAIGDRVEPQQRGLGSRAELREAQVESIPGLRRPHRHAARGLPVARRQLGVRTIAHVGEPDEVGVRIENDDAQVGLEQQPLEHEPK